MGDTYGTAVVAALGAGAGLGAAALAQGRRRSFGGLAVGAVLGGLGATWLAYVADAVARGPEAGLTSSDPTADLLLRYGSGGL